MKAIYQNSKHINIFLFAFLNFLIFLNSFESINCNFLSNEIKQRKIFRNLATDERTQGANENCIAVYEYQLFDLFKLGDDKKNISSGEHTIFIQFCKNIDKLGGSVIYNNTKGEEIKLAGNINGEKDSKNKVNVSNSKVDEKDVNTTKKVTLHLAKGQNCLNSKSNESYDFSIILTCDESKEYEFTKINSYNPKDTCKFVMEAKSKYACGGDYYQISKILGENSLILGIIFVFAGPILALIGYKFRNCSIYSILIVVFPIIGIFICALFDLTNTILICALLFVFLVLGIILAYFLTSKQDHLKYYTLVVGGIFGALIAHFIYLVIVPLIETTSQNIISLAIIITGAVAGVFLGIFCPKFAIIIGTSTLGGYILMRGISLLLVNQIKYINESEIFDYASTGNYEKIGEMITPLFYIYPAAFIIFIVVFTLLQYKLNPKFDDIDNYKDLDSGFEPSNKLDKDFRVTATSISED